MEAPKLFISYSWSSQAHEQWVINLATELTESGVHVILDKWDLKEGNDSVAFMERMVTDPKITKVVIICDEVYASKADGRNGGVGTETQIISREVYENQDQGKFVAVIAEKDMQGKAYLPTYYKSRIYIDLSEPDKFNENFEQLLRWIYDKPLHERPALGKRPSFLDESNGISLGTTAAYKRALSAIRENKIFAPGVLDEYLSLFSSNLERFRITRNNTEFDDLLIDNIESFIPYRNEMISIIINLAQYSSASENIVKLHRFFESLIPYMDVPENVSRWHESDFDNFKFIIHELFLYTVAILIKYEKFAEVNALLTEQYYIVKSARSGESKMVDYNVFREYLTSLEYRNNRLDLKRLSLHADLLKQRSSISGIDFRYLMQADFVLFLRNDIKQSDCYNRWWPYTLVYAGHFHGAFEIFARSSSKSYFEKVKIILGIDDISEIKKLMTRYQNNIDLIPRWSYERLNPTNLLGFENLSTIE